MKGIFMVGVSGSGKTTWVKSHKEYVACSTDSVIEQLAEVMGISYTEAFDYILNDKDFVIDRTHLKRNIRISLINELKSFALEHGKNLELTAVSFELP